MTDMDDAYLAWRDKKDWIAGRTAYYTESGLPEELAERLALDDWNNAFGGE
jgi:hypothetical protein